MTTVRILCWGHRRAVGPFEAVRAAFAQRRPYIDLQIDVRPLSDFEHQGMAGVVEKYDVIVYDHPFSGDITENGLFLPLDELLPDLVGPDADGRYVGGTLPSYRMAGRIWGAPIDAATQNAVYRADLLAEAGEEAPQSWPDAVALGARLSSKGLSLGLAVQAPHALLAVAALAANAGRPWSTDPYLPLAIDRAGFLDGLQRVRDLLAYCPREAMDWNSIDLHDAMVARDDIAFCPCVYGYATYGEADMRRPLSFAAFAGAVPPYHAGSAIGGTAAGVSSATKVREEALALVRFLLEGETQDRLIPGHHGQAALLSSWTDPQNDRRFNGFFFAVRPSMETVWIRPRHPGYVGFQNEAGAVVAEGLRDGASDKAILDGVLACAERVRPLASNA